MSLHWVVIMTIQQYATYWVNLLKFTCLNDYVDVLFTLLDTLQVHSYIKHYQGVDVSLCVNSVISWTD